MRDRFYEEFKRNDAVLNRTSKVTSNNIRVNVKPAKMTTQAAVKSGKNVEEAVRRTKNSSMSKNMLKKIIESEPFKGVSAFIKFFGPDFNIIPRIVIDPAHEMHNLVKDVLGLWLNVGGMEFKPKRLSEEKKMGRYSRYNNNTDAVWRINSRLLVILSTLMESGQLKIPEAWPKLLNYFSEEYEKIKLAESMAFCGDRGCYFVGLTNLPADVKDLFCEVLRVAGGFIKKSTSRAQLEK